MNHRGGVRGRPWDVRPAAHSYTSKPFAIPSLRGSHLNLEDAAALCNVKCGSSLIKR